MFLIKIYTQISYINNKEYIMSLLDINVQDKDILLHLILKHCQQFVSKEIKILETKMYDSNRVNQDDNNRVNWDDILSNPDDWRAYYISSLKTNWDVIVIFTNARLISPRTRSGHTLRGGHKISEFIEGTIKPSYLT